MSIFGDIHFDALNINEGCLHVFSPSCHLSPFIGCQRATSPTPLAFFAPFPMHTVPSTQPFQSMLSSRMVEAQSNGTLLPSDGPSVYALTGGIATAQLSVEPARRAAGTFVRWLGIDPKKSHYTVIAIFNQVNQVVTIDIHSPSQTFDLAVILDASALNSQGN
jgi:hypothetical protein